MNTMQDVTFDIEALYELPGEAFRIYMWIKIYLPRHGYEMSYREIATNLFMSPTTVRKHIDFMVEHGWVERTVNVGMTATYRILR